MFLHKYVLLCLYIIDYYTKVHQADVLDARFI